MTVPTLSDLSARITGTIREQQLFRSGDALIVGLSGGADSTALLDLLAGLPGIPLRLIAAHLNHCLRGAESDGDEEFCRELAGRYQIPFESRRVDVKSIADKNTLNLEDAGRQARIAFFDELQGSYNSAAVVLAHHSDDQAETVLMRLLRGSGMTGLAGMTYRNRRGYVRPLLDISRAEIVAYLVERKLVWREDVTNLDQSFLRNRIRHELLPLLEQYNPSVRKCLSTTASILSAENDLLNDQTEQVAEQLFSITAQETTCNITHLKSLPLALQRRIIRLALSRLHGNLEQFSHQHIDSIYRLITSGRSNSKINLPQGIVAVKEYDTLVFRFGITCLPQTTGLQITGPGIYKLPFGATITVELSSAPADFGTSSATSAYFDLDKCPFPWHVRTFRPGDRIQQIGMSGRKKVKNIFIDSKIPLLQRSRTPLISCNEEIIWVCGLHTSEHASLEKDSSRIIKIMFSRTA